jgi:dTDP-4-dehydrorhamnose reductase
MRILITGSNGLTGQAIVREAVKFNEIEIIATSKSPNRNADTQKFELLDITRPENINYLLDLYQPNCIIHTAAISQIDTCEQDKSLCYTVNYKAVQTLCDACQKRNIHLIHMSSDFVFDGQSSLPYSEYDETNPVNYYGECKRLAEEYLMQSACKFSIVRTVLVYDYPLDIKRSNIFRWIYDSLKSQQEIHVVNDQFRTPTFVDDLAKALLKLAIGKHEGIWHICGKEQISVYDFAKRIADSFNLNADLIQTVNSSALNQPGRRPAKTYLNISKAENEIQFNPNRFNQSFNIIASRIKN